jgi:hypothetical protein
LHPYFGGILDLVGAFCVMNSHGRIWDYRTAVPGWRRGVCARDGRQWFKAFMRRVRHVVMDGHSTSVKGRLYPDGTFVAENGKRCFLKGNFS